MMNLLRTWLHGGDPSLWAYTRAYGCKSLIDGTVADGDLMRRWINGKWQYRKLTDEEFREQLQKEAF